MICNHSLCQWIYHVGYTSSHTNTEVKQHWAWILLGWETLQGIPGSAGAYPPPPLQTEYSLFRLSLSQSSDWDPLKQTKNFFKQIIGFVKHFFCSIFKIKFWKQNAFSWRQRDGTDLDKICIPKFPPFEWCVWVYLLYREKIKTQRKCGTTGFYALYDQSYIIGHCEQFNYFQN